MDGSPNGLMAWSRAAADRNSAKNVSAKQVYSKAGFQPRRAASKTPTNSIFPSNNTDISTMGRKSHYDSLDDLYAELDHESIFDEDDPEPLDESDLALLNTRDSQPRNVKTKTRKPRTPKPAPAKKTRRPASRK